MQPVPSGIKVMKMAAYLYEGKLYGTKEVVIQEILYDKVWTWSQQRLPTLPDSVITSITLAIIEDIDLFVDWKKEVLEAIEFVD